MRARIVLVLIAAVVLALVAAVAAGCGSGSGHAGLTTAQQKALVRQLEAVRSAAADGDFAATRAAVSSFRDSVTRLRHARAISASAAHELRVGASRILARARSDSAPPAQPTVTQTVTTPAPAPQPSGPPGKAKGHKKKDHGHGHGHGHGKKGKD